MSDNQETIADIIAEMRDLAANRDWHNHTGQSNRERVLYLADRLEAAIRRDKAAIEADALAVGGIVGAAHRREMSKNTSKNGADFGQLGDCAKLREALVSVKKSIDDMGAASLDGDPEVLLASLTQVCARLSARIDAALAATEQEGGNDGR